MDYVYYIRDVVHVGFLTLVANPQVTSYDEYPFLIIYKIFLSGLRVLINAILAHFYCIIYV